jgi:hypothetical protein
LGETEGLSPWSQYNPHGIFIALENVGYALINIAFILVGLAMTGMPSRLWRAAGWVFVAGGALTLALLVFYSVNYRARLDYRFEVAAIGITWLVLIAAPLLSGIAAAAVNQAATCGAPQHRHDSQMTRQLQNRLTSLGRNRESKQGESLVRSMCGSNSQAPKVRVGFMLSPPQLELDVESSHPGSDRDYRI